MNGYSALPSLALFQFEWWGQWEKMKLKGQSNNITTAPKGHFTKVAYTNKTRPKAGLTQLHRIFLCWWANALTPERSTSRWQRWRKGESEQSKKVLEAFDLSTNQRYVIWKLISQFYQSINNGKVGMNEYRLILTFPLGFGSIWWWQWAVIAFEIDIRHNLTE